MKTNKIKYIEEFEGGKVESKFDTRNEARSYEKKRIRIKMKIKLKNYSEGESDERYED